MRASDRLVWLVAAVLLLLLTAVPAGGQPACFDRTALFAQLDADFAEAPIALGLTDDGALLEVVASPDGRTWTIALTLANGASCVLATGIGWETIPVVVRGREG